MNNVSVSVVIPSYNHARYIGPAIQSVLDQKLYAATQLELIIVDDGSTDSSLDVIHRFTDPRLRLIAQENQGAHAAINVGLHAAHGEFLAILNSDDTYHPQRLNKLLAALRADGEIGLIGSHIDIINSDGQVVGAKHGYADAPPWLLAAPDKSFRGHDNLAEALLTENYFATTSNFLFRRHWLEVIGDFRPLRYVHDWDFALRLIQKARVTLLPESLMQYRVHPTNTIRDNRAAMVLELCWCLAVHTPAYMRQHVTASLRPEFISRLMRSIYVYGCEHVLQAMLMEGLADDDAAALALLVPGDVRRKQYLDAIQEQVAADGEPAAARVPGATAHLRYRLHTLLTRLQLRR